MNYQIIDSVRIKRTTYELGTDGFFYYVAKIINEKLTFLFHSSETELALDFFKSVTGKNN